MWQFVNVGSLLQKFTKMCCGVRSSTDVYRNIMLQQLCNDSGLRQYQSLLILGGYHLFLSSSHNLFEKWAVVAYFSREET